MMKRSAGAIAVMPAVQTPSPLSRQLPLLLMPLSLLLLLLLAPLSPSPSPCSSCYSFSHPMLLLPAMAQDFYEGTDVVELTPRNFKTLVLQSEHPWMIEFYAPWCGHCQRLKPDYLKAATSTKGIVKFGAINCDVHKQMASDYGIRGFPTLKIFGSNKKKPEDYNGARSAKSMADALLAALPNKVATVSSKSHESFLRDGSSAALPLALLFTSKSTTTPLYKGLALDLKGRMMLGEVRGKKEKQLMLEYKVKEEELPVLLVLPSDGAGKNGEWPRYEGELKHAPLLKFLEKFAAPKKGKEKKSEKESKSKEAPPSSSSPKTAAAAKGTLQKLTTVAELEAQCVKLKKGFCVIAFLRGDKSAELDTLSSLAAKYAGDPLHFLWMDSSNPLSFALRDTLLASSPPSVVVLNPKRGKFTVVEGQEGLAGLESVLDRAIGGDLVMGSKVEEGWHNLLLEK